MKAEWACLLLATCYLALTTYDLLLKAYYNMKAKRACVFGAYMRVGRGRGQKLNR